MLSPGRQAQKDVADLSRQVEHLQKASEQTLQASRSLLLAVETLAERVDELERLAGLHGTVVLPPETHLPPELLQRAIEKMD